MSTQVRRQILSRVYLGFISLAAALLISLPVFASPTETPERETLRIARSLHPITDDAWKQVAGEQIAGKYDITRGDTLYDISKRLFGDARYWPKIWAMNNNSILNPHLIRPGNKIAFMPGTGTSLPSVSIETSDGAPAAAHAEPTTLTDTDSGGLPPIPKPRARSQEWKMLPEQSWEASRIEAEEAAKNELAVMGSLDKVHTLTPSRELSIFAASQPLSYIGEIVSSPTITTYLKTGDQVLIRGLHEEIKAGETYSLTHTPDALEKNELKRQGYAYHVDGEIQIIGVQNGYWIGLIKQGRGMMERGSKLIPLVPRIKPLDPVPAPAGKDAQFYVDKGTSTSITGQYSFGFVNLGSEDGLQEGMVLENYQPQDLNTGKPLAYQNLFHVSDMQVVQVSEHFSTVQIIFGAAEVYDGMPVHLVTDLSRLQKYGAFPNGKDAPTNPADVPVQSADENGDATIPPPAPSPEPLPPPVPSPEVPAPQPSQEVPPPITAPVAEPVPVPAPAPTQAVAPEAPPAPAPVSAPEVPPQPVQEQQAPPPPPTAPEPVAPQKPAPVKNELDALDGEEKLNPNEERELKQLENYKAKTPEVAPAAEGSAPAPPAPEQASPAPEQAPPAPDQAPPAPSAEGASPARGLPEF